MPPSAKDSAFTVMDSVASEFSFLTVIVYVPSFISKTLAPSLSVLYDPE